MTIKLSDHFTVRRLLKFTLPSIAMMIFTSIYGVVDGFFVSNYAGQVEFTAVNFIMPFLMMLGAIGFMFGTGGSALVAKTMGEGDCEKAQRIFSMVIYLSVGLGIVISALGIAFLRPLAAWLGAEGELLENCVTYGRIILLANPAFILQMEFQSFFITAEKPQLGLIVTVAAGVANMVLDFVLVGLLPWGIEGAAAATALSQVVGGLVPMFYFARRNGSCLRFTRFSFDGKALLKTCTNGSSELMSNISMSLVGLLYNVQLLAYAGENGVAAYGVMMYVNFVFISVFIGYSIGTAPIVSYHFGAQNHGELRGLLRKSLMLIIAAAVGMLVLSLALAKPLSALFVGYDAVLLDMTVSGFRIFALSFLFSGFAIYFSGFFTALNDGLTSAVISFLRTLVFQIAAVLLLPLLWDLDGIWISVVVAEAMAVLTGLVFLIGKQKKYHY